MASALPSAEAITDYLTEVGKAVHAGLIAKHFEVERPSYHQLLARLEELAARREIQSAGGDRYRVVTGRSRANSWTGTLTVNQRGFGFVSAPPRPDVFIPAEALGGALHGDTVVVEATRTSARGSEGVVVSVVTRRIHRVAGLIRVKRNSAWLEPDDTRVRGPIQLVGDLQGARDGQAAVIEITRFPEETRENPEGQVVAVLGTPGEVHVEVAKIKLREQIEEQHPEAAVAEAEKIATTSRRLSLGTRRDLREVPFLTIDPTDARDHDDAVWATRTESGYKVYVAIADVSHYVQPGTALDDEANKRGCTIYLPDRAIPMLPGVLAADLCSLLPEKERYCLCVIADLDEHGVVETFEIVEGLMRAAAMISYDSAARTLGFSELPPLSLAAEAFKKDLKCLAQVSGKLRRARMRRGALDLDLPEAKLELDEAGVPTGVHKRTHDPGIKRAYQLIEELMLLANEVVARWLTEQEVPTIYRVHGRPDDEKIARLAAIAELVGAPFEATEMASPKAVAKWLTRIEKHPRRAVLEGFLLRSLRQATYDTVNIGHFGLASEAYLHFTSPIRRYPDLAVHRTVKQILNGVKMDISAAAIEVLRTAASNASSRERLAMQVEREVMDLYRVLYMRHRIGEIFEGTTSSIVGGGVFVQIDDPFVDALVRFESLGQERFELSDDELSLIAPRSGEHILLGDKMIVEIEDVSILRRSIYARRLSSFSQVQDDGGEEGAPRFAGRAKPARGAVPGPFARKERTASGSAFGARGSGPKDRKGGSARGAGRSGAADAGGSRSGAAGSGAGRSGTGAGRAGAGAGRSGPSKGKPSTGRAGKRVAKKSGKKRR